MESDYYAPSEDTFLLAESVENYRGEAALEIAAGTGYVSNLLKEHFSLVVATDINPAALRKFPNSVDVVCCDSASAISNVNFDLIVLNPPYLPSDKIEDITVDGGPDGVEVTLRFMRDAIRLLKPMGSILFVSSSLAKHELITDYLRANNFHTEIVRKRRIGFEELLVIRAVRN